MTNKENQLTERVTPEASDQKLNAVYTERMIVVRMLAVMSGCKYGVGVDKSRERCDPWRFVVYIDLPAGQVSWHIAPQDRHLFEDFPAYEGDWDGAFNGRSADFAKSVKPEHSYKARALKMLYNGRPDK